MADIDIDAPPAAPPLGPGESDPLSPVRGVAGPASPPLGPGDSVGEVDDAEMITPQPAGPGGVETGPRHVTRIPKALNPAAEG